MSKYSDQVMFMKSHPLWEDFEKFIVDHRPSVPAYNHREDNTPEWKYRCAQREGFDLAMKLLNIEVEK